VGPEEKGALTYTVVIPSLGLDSLHIELQIQDWEGGDSVRLLAPPVYADNPVLEQTGNNFCNLQIEQLAGSPVVYSFDSVRVGLYNSLSVAFHREHLPVLVSYDIKFQYNDSTRMPVPRIGDQAGYLQGNYLFMIPYKSTETVDIWRDNFQIIVRYLPGASVPFNGDPTSQSYYRNSYELMFSNCALGGTLQIQGLSGGQAFRFVGLSQNDSISLSLYQSTADNMGLLLEDISPIFGIIREAPITVIFGVNSAGGLEGMYSFSMRDPRENDSLGATNMIMAHEILHSWIGVRVGDYDDPWWKEGTTNYLGFLIAKRNNLITQAYLDSCLLADLSLDSNVAVYSLSDATVRDHLFNRSRPGDWMLNLVYTKGAQVNMLLDRRIRSASLNLTSLDKVLGSFVSLYDGTAFTRNEYLTYIRENSGAEVGDLFQEYVDKSGAIPDSVLLDNYIWLAQTGAFGEVEIPSVTVGGSSGRALFKW
jgi:hypothetical protein